MSSTSSAPFLVLDLVPSRWLLIGLGCFHLLALASLFVISLPWWIKLVLGVLIGGSGWLNYHRYGNATSRRFIARAQRTVDGHWRVGHADGREYAARLTGSYTHPQLVILNFAVGRWSRRSVVVLPDRFQRTDWRGYGSLCGLSKKMKKIPLSCADEHQISSRITCNITEQID
ncbi:MAG: protein YgfX [Candidatus Competibacteraceae bacterium]